ncbi:hypothetical protein V5D56_01925 [Cellulosimicrobium sp. PMB13]|uniref:hypothetical protein n=1 Tax=Cellulosimicrobium sp. PMB13 TaxID=3120158 RepID=UPI003F4B145C
MNENELVDGAELYRTKGRGRLHVLGCSHLQTTDLSQLIVADATDRAERELCSECDKEIRGGRTEYPSLACGRLLRTSTSTWCGHRKREATSPRDTETGTRRPPRTSTGDSSTSISTRAAMSGPVLT